MEKNMYMVSIDNGLSVGKAALVDKDGNIESIASFKNEIINEGCFSELDMELFYRKTADSVKNLIIKTGINPSDIISVGNSGHGGGIYPVDANGTPVRRAITSMDSRAESLIFKWKTDGIDSYSSTYTNMWNGQAIPLLYWLKENERSNYDRIAKVLFCKDWIKFKLTGNYSTDYTDASNGGLINLTTKEYDVRLYKQFGMDELFDRLPELNKSEEVIGYVTKKAAVETGLNEGTPVIGGLVDFVACMFGSGIYDNSAYSVVSGTWGINSAFKDELVASPDIISTVLFPDAGSFMAMDASPNSAVNLEWFISEILEKTGFIKADRKEIYIKIDEEIEKINKSESGVLYFPFLFRSKLTKKMEGMFYGFDASDDIYSLIYAIYEGVVFSHLMHINNLIAGGADCKTAVLSGGASNSSLWCQLFADVLNMEIVKTSTKEVGALGLAIFQALGLGTYKNLKEAIGKMVTTETVFKPDKQKNSVYMKRFAEFERIIKLLDV